MKRAPVIALQLVLLLLVAATLDARERRPKRQSNHFTFQPDRLQEKIADFREQYDRVILRNEFHTLVTEGEGICKLVWTGRRVDYIFNPGGDAAEGHASEVALEMPRGADLDQFKLYLVQEDGQTGAKTSDHEQYFRGDTLIIAIPDLHGAVVVDLTYRFLGDGVTVDESFLFQPQWPQLDATYSFSVSRDLWQEAVDQGLHWEFNATTFPLTWDPARDDTPENFTWVWMRTNMEPMPENAILPNARRVDVKGYLPAPALAGINPEDLPELDALQALAELENQLRQAERMVRDQTASTGPSTESSGRSAGLPDAVGKKQ